MNREFQPRGTQLVAQGQDVGERIDGAFLGAPEDSDHGVDRPPLGQAPLEDLAKLLHAQAAVTVDGDVDEISGADPEDGGRLREGIVLVPFQAAEIAARKLVHT